MLVVADQSLGLKITHKVGNKSHIKSPDEDIHLACFSRNYCSSSRLEGKVYDGRKLGASD
jgi:hypothetical protein